MKQDLYHISSLCYDDGYDPVMFPTGEKMRKGSIIKAVVMIIGLAWADGVMDCNKEWNLMWLVSIQCLLFMSLKVLNN